MNKTAWLLFAVIVAFGFTSCATMKAVPHSASIDNFFDLVNEGDASLLTSVTSIPMLIDSEIVTRSPEVSRFWEALGKAGFSIDSSFSYESTRVNSETFRTFARTMEVQTFFEKYVPKTAVTVVIPGTGGKWIFLFSGRTGRYPYILGLTGPVK